MMEACAYMLTSAQIMVDRILGELFTFFFSSLAPGPVHAASFVSSVLV